MIKSFVSYGVPLFGRSKPSIGKTQFDGKKAPTGRLIELVGNENRHRISAAGAELGKELVYIPALIRHPRTQTDVISVIKVCFLVRVTLPGKHSIEPRFRSLTSWAYLAVLG
jgi:hypothetical protein